LRIANTRHRPVLFAVLLFFLVSPASSTIAQTVTGVWQQIDPATGKVGALVTFAENGGIFSGFISQLFPDPGDDPNPLCHQCPGIERDKPILGLTFIQGMRRSGLVYEGGTILDPDSGTLYSANMQLSPDGNTLTVRGYVGISLFGQNQTWKRVQ
jgi:Uncharacterized protein conserved in bacteria (DUF2147)